MEQIRIIEGWTRDLGIPDEWMEKGKSGKWEIYNAARPFPAHHTTTGEFIHGVFYGAIDPNLDYVDEYRRRAGELDASRLVFVTQAEVETWGRAFCKEHGVEYDDYEFDVIARSYVRNMRKEQDHE